MRRAGEPGKTASCQNLVVQEREGTVSAGGHGTAGVHKGTWRL